MSSPLKQNTTTIQELLNTINSLPEAENLDTEISTQSTLLSEQDAKIAELAQVLAGKAGGSSGTNVETYTGTVSNNWHLGETATVYYTDSSMTIQMFDVDGNKTDNKVIEVAKNTVIAIVYSNFYITSTNIELLGDDYTILLPTSNEFTILFQ